MKTKTIYLVVGLGAAYYFLSQRQPVFQQMSDGTYQPAGALDKLTVMLTGAQPPQAQKVTVNIPGYIDVSYQG